MSRTGPGYPQQPRPGYQQQHQQGYPPGQQPYGQQQPYGMYKSGMGGSKTGYMLMGLLAAALGLAAIILAVKYFTLNERAEQAVTENNKLRKENRSLSDQNKAKDDQLAKAGQSAYVPINDATGKSLSQDVLLARCKDLEKEVHALQREGAWLRSKMTAEQIEDIKKETDVDVEEIKVERLGNNQTRATFRVVNRAGQHANNVQGTIRFWNGPSIAYEKPFLIPRIDKQSSVTMEISAPIDNFTSYDGYVKPGGSY